MARDTTDTTTPTGTGASELPNRITIVGRGVPSNFEIAVAGDLELVGGDPRENGIVIAGGVAEGAIDTGVHRFRFAGELANVRLVDWNGETAPESPSTPTVHVEYGVSR